MTDKQMSTEARAGFISNIIAQMRLEAKRKNKAFDGGDLFFSLAFRTDDQLREIARACGVR